MRLRRSLRERIRWCKTNTLPGQTLKRKKWIVASIVLIFASFDVILLYIGDKAIFSLLLDAPYLPKEYAQAYTHLTTLKKYSNYTKAEVINEIAFSSDGQILATAGYKEVLLWDIRTGSLLSTFKVNSNWMDAVIFSPDGKTLATVSGDSIWLWNVKTGASQAIEVPPFIWTKISQS